ncbi:hypothetical protein IJJ27_03925 [bacterium]|nr:hypothetical protein [bacterium]
MMKKNKIASLLASFLVGAALFSPALASADSYQLSSFKPDSVNVETDANKVASSVVSIVVAAAAVLMFVYLLWGAIDMITAGGESDKFKKGIDKIKYAIIGLMVVAASWAVFQLVIYIAFGQDDLTIPTLGSSS